jgi:hypothetical protein
MAGIYRQRHPEHSVFYRVFFYYFERMRIVSFIEEPKTIDRIIAHLELTFEAERPPLPHHVQQDLLMAAENSGEYF